jgi:NodT family efflux transporter outer membrane factor (OMF) lipoprotein
METTVAALKGATERFRAVVMTALTFILGTFPMVIATGAGSASQRSIGTTVFYGMIVATSIGILFVPAYFSFFDRISLKYTLEKKKINILFIMIFIGSISACTMGPDYEQPQFFTQHELEHALNASTRESTRFTPYDFNDDTLNVLIDKALENSPTLKQALWRLRGTRAGLAITKAGLFPTFDITGQYNDVKNSKNMGLILNEDYYQAGLDATWEIDLFGSQRRRIEAEKANLKSTLYTVQNTAVSLTAEVARIYIHTRTLQELVRQTRENISLHQKMTELVMDKQKTGLASGLSPEQALYLLKDTSATLTDLEYQLAESKNALALILGELPGSEDNLLKPDEESLITRPFDFDLEKITRISANILRHRPDVRASEENLIAQNALVGVAIADMFPKLSLSALLGIESLTWGKLWEKNSLTHTITPDMTIPLFHFGALKENIERQKALKEEYLLTYQQTLLQAANEIKNAVIALYQEHQHYILLQETYNHANQVAELMQSKYKNGLIDYTDVLQAEQNRLQAQIQMIQSSGALYTNLIRFYKAIGGEFTQDIYTP